MLAEATALGGAKTLKLEAELGEALGRAAELEERVRHLEKMQVSAAAGILRAI